MNEDKANMYIRQTTLAEIGLKGQEKLFGSRVVIVGCGGLGGAAAVHMAASGIGHLHLIDYDMIDLSNLHRQVYYQRDQVGKSKARTLASYIERISPFIKVSFEEKAITKQNIEDQLKGFTYVVDCTDSLATKYLLNDYCVLNNKILVYGSLYKHDGYIAVFNVASDTGNSAHLRDAFPVMPQKRVPNCSEVGTLNPIVGIIGIMQANEIIKMITGTGQLLVNKILIYNTMENSKFEMKLKPGFPFNRVEQLFDKEDYFDDRCQLQNANLLISADQLKTRLDSKNLKIVSVIENTAVPIPFKVDLKIPLSMFDPIQLKEISSNEIIIVCHRGISSYTATEQMKKTFPETVVYSLKDGIDQFEGS